ncbi:MAG: multicopper oxidase domain-containing protein [Moorea sp. SIO2I5]|nr:multicopper oxidase domain-containing protein [Moorena sp. SIO2I5]
MSDPQRFQGITLNRRQFLEISLGGIGLAGIAIGAQRFLPLRAASPVSIPPLPGGLPNQGNGVNPMLACRDFDYGTLKQESGRTVREFQITAGITELELNRVVRFPAWTYNGRVPGPTLRAKEGDRVRVIFHNHGGHAHTMHFHGIHPSGMDGVEPVRNNDSTVYEFDALPYGLHLYHCHIAPVTRHISKGLYGAFIVDPKKERPPADEILMVMTGYEIVIDDKPHKLYGFNGLPNYFKQHPLPIYQNQLIRLYLINVIEFEPAVTFHLHANFFQVYPTGMTLRPTHETDVITMGTAERHILEFMYPFSGQYMFHPHQDEIAEKGCMGLFNVLEGGADYSNSKSFVKSAKSGIVAGKRL